MRNGLNIFGRPVTCEKAVCNSAVSPRYLLSIAELGVTDENTWSAPIKGRRQASGKPAEPSTLDPGWAMVAIHLMDASCQRRARRPRMSECQLPKNTVAWLGLATINLALRTPLPAMPWTWRLAGQRDWRAA